MATIAIKNLAKVEVPPTSSPKVYVSNKVNDLEFGTTTFDLHVEEEAFVGYMCAILSFSQSTDGQKLGSIKLASNIMTLKINAGSPIGTTDEKSQAVNIPVGVYPNCTIQLDATVGSHVDINVDLDFILSLDYNYNNGIDTTYVGAMYVQVGVPLG